MVLPPGVPTVVGRGACDVCIVVVPYTFGTTTTVVIVTVTERGKTENIPPISNENPSLPHIAGGSGDRGSITKVVPKYIEERRIKKII